ncbi:hypothetical protein ACNO7T_22920 [Vibrio campbellii]
MLSGVGQVPILGALDEVLSDNSESIKESEPSSARSIKTKRSLHDKKLPQVLNRFALFHSNQSSGGSSSDKEESRNFLRFLLNADRGCNSDVLDKLRDKDGNLIAGRVADLVRLYPHLEESIQTTVHAYFHSMRQDEQHEILNHAKRHYIDNISNSDFDFLLAPQLEQPINSSTLEVLDNVVENNGAGLESQLKQISAELKLRLEHDQMGDILQTYTLMNWLRNIYNLFKGHDQNKTINLFITEGIQLGKVAELSFLLPITRKLIGVNMQDKYKTMENILISTPSTLFPDGGSGSSEKQNETCFILRGFYE